MHEEIQGASVLMVVVLKLNAGVGGALLASPFSCCLFYMIIISVRLEVEMEIHLEPD